MTPEPPEPRPVQSGAGSPDILSWYRSADEPRLPARRARWRLARRERLDALACLGLSALCFSHACLEILFRADRDFYNRVPVRASTLLALVLNIVAVGALGFAGVQAIRRAHRLVWRRLGAIAISAGLLVTLNFVRITYAPLAQWADWLRTSGLLAIVVMALGAALAWPGPALYVMRRVALVASPVTVVILSVVPWMFLEAAVGPVWRPTEPKPLDRTPPSLRRVVWIVFGELDQRITFEARPAGLDLPELDRLRREALYAVNARPPAAATEVTMPALITGRPVVAVAPLGPNDLELTFTDGKTAPWSAHSNVFTRTRTQGYDTALIGWGLPYPRVLGGSLGAADWRPSAFHEASRGATFAEAMWNQWASLAPPANIPRLSARRFEELAALALRAATNGRFGLVLLHLPVPGPPAIYDRATERLAPWSFLRAGEGYLDNLALADRMLGQLRRGLEQARLDDLTWLVVTSDRPWQASKHYDGREDPRVPFLVRPPHGGHGTHVDAALNTLVTHDLALAILRGSIPDARDAATWLERQRVAAPRDYTRLGRPVY